MVTSGTLWGLDKAYNLFLRCRKPWSHSDAYHRTDRMVNQRASKPLEPKSSSKWAVAIQVALVNNRSVKRGYTSFYRTRMPWKRANSYTEKHIKGRK